MSFPPNSPNHSADIALWIDCGSHGQVPLSQASEAFVIAAAPTVIPACEARIFLRIDGTVYERAVQLVDGFSADSREAAVLALDHAPTF